MTSPAEQTAADPRLAAADVVVVGCGAAGTVAAEGLARAGVGRITLVDQDVAVLKNLATHALVTVEDVERSREKAVAAADALRAIAPDVEVVPVVTELSKENAGELLDGARLVIDATDTRGAHLLVDAATRRSGTPWVLARAEGRLGVVAAFRPPARPCVRCCTPALASLREDREDPWARAEKVALASTAARLAGSLALERGIALLLAGIPSSGVLSIRAGTEAVAVTPSGSAPGDAFPCPVCDFGEARDPSEEELAGTGSRGPGSFHFPAAGARRVDVQALALRVGGRRSVLTTRLSVTIHGEGGSVTCFADGRMVVRGAPDPDRARALAARLVSA